MAVWKRSWTWLAIVGFGVVAAACWLLWQTRPDPAPGVPASGVDQVLTRDGPMEPATAPLLESPTDQDHTGGTGPDRLRVGTTSETYGTDERIARAKASSPYGELEHPFLSSLVDQLSSLEAAERENLHQYLASGGQVGTPEHLDHVFNFEGAAAKKAALLERNYVLLRSREQLPSDIWRDENIHVVLGPGGIKDGVSLRAFILIDLRKHGRFAAAKKDLRTSR